MDLKSDFENIDRDFFYDFSKNVCFVYTDGYYPVCVCVCEGGDEYGVYRRVFQAENCYLFNPLRAP